MHALARFPPPALFVIAFLLALRVQEAAPATLGLGRAGEVGGTALVVAGALLGASCLFLFLWRRTTIVPHHRAAQLVTAGPYRVSRNPMYVGLAVVYLGATLLWHTPWPLAFLVLPLGFLRLVTIPVEERTLTEAFGDAYRAYQRRVRRWL